MYRKFEFVLDVYVGLHDVCESATHLDEVSEEERHTYTRSKSSADLFTSVDVADLTFEEDPHQDVLRERLQRFHSRVSFRHPADEG